LADQIPRKNSKFENSLAIERPREQRKFGRRPVFKAAVLALDSGERLPGTVLNLSEGGAKIKMAKPELLKGEFYLEIPGDDLIVKCSLIHIEGDVAGLQYIKPPRRLSWLKR
jgi:PilZ domain